MLLKEGSGSGLPIPSIQLDWRPFPTIFQGEVSPQGHVFLESPSTVSGENGICLIQSQPRQRIVFVYVQGNGVHCDRDDQGFVPALVILALSRDQLGIGYSGIGLQTSNVRIVPLAEIEGMPWITPSAATVADQTYPLRRLLYLYFDKEPDASLPPAIQEFLTFVKSREGQEAVVRAGFYPLPMDQVEKLAVALRAAPASPSAAKQ